MARKWSVHLLNNTASYDLSQVFASGISAQGTGQIGGHIRQIRKNLRRKGGEDYDEERLRAMACISAEGSLPAMTTAL
jgi:ribosomal protein L6P/L9E